VIICVTIFVSSAALFSIPFLPVFVLWKWYQSGRCPTRLERKGLCGWLCHLSDELRTGRCGMLWGSPERTLLSFAESTRCLGCTTSPSMVVGMYELLQMVISVYHVLSQCVGGVLLCVRTWCSSIYDFLVFFCSWYNALVWPWTHTVMSSLPWIMHKRIRLFIV
jgi:hypothetical protein